MNECIVFVVVVVVVVNYSFQKVRSRVCALLYLFLIFNQKNKKNAKKKLSDGVAVDREVVDDEDDGAKLENRA